jgi:predicted nuclease of predicted toxin-antitoxin system
MKFLVDEDLSPTLAARLADEGHPASHVAYIGLKSTTDWALWDLALARDEVVITANARDFLRLARKAEVHPGLIVLREGELTRDEQWNRVRTVLRHLAAAGIEDLVNHVVEIGSSGAVLVREIPSSGQS